MRTYVYAGENEDSVIRVSRKSAETYVISRDSLLMVSEEDRLRRTDYLGNLVMTGGKPETYLFDGGYCSFDAAGHAVFHYYDRDHLGNVRAVVGYDGAVEQVMNYYPLRRALLRRDRAQRRPAAIQVQRQGA